MGCEKTSNTKWKRSISLSTVMDGLQQAIHRGCFLSQPSVASNLIELPAIVRRAPGISNRHDRRLLLFCALHFAIR